MDSFNYKQGGVTEQILEDAPRLLCLSIFAHANVPIDAEKATFRDLCQVSTEFQNADLGYMSTASDVSYASSCCIRIRP